MKKTLSIVLTVAATFTIVGCQKTIQPTPKENETKTFERLRDVGKEIPNPKITFGDCIPEGSEATLKSIRYVEGKPIYYMDYTAKVDWESLLTDPEHQTPLFGVKEVTNKVSKALFRGFEPKVPIKGAKGSCSGFICKNSKGEILNGRNFDGNYGEMVVVFNHNVKPGEHKSVMMTDLNSAQKFSGIGGYAGDKIVLLLTGCDKNQQQSDIPTSGKADLVVYGNIYTADYSAGRGSITKGKWADFIVIDQDVLNCPAMEIANTKVLKTYFEGKYINRFSKSSYENLTFPPGNCCGRPVCRLHWKS